MSYLYQVSGRHCEKRARRSYLQLNMYREWRHCYFHARLTKQNFSSETTEASQSCNKKQQLSFDKSRSIFLTKYFNRQTDQPLSKHYTVKLDLDGLRKARYLRITKRGTKRVSVLSLCCDQRQETFVDLGLFQTTNDLS